jgi:murein DD-endopeptidase MepM/ murein hydrolase activator NlpD
MQKNDKFYTFLLSHRSKNKIYIRKIQISKQFLHFGSIAIFLFTGFAVLGLGLSGLVRSTVLAKSNDDLGLAAKASLTTAQTARDIEYQRPKVATDIAVNSGGPEFDDENDSEDAALAQQLKALSTSMDPADLPNVWPHIGKINNEFGFRRNPFGGRSYEFHPGMDIDGERGDQVLAPAGGTVIKAGYNGGYGNMVEIDHGNGLSTRYGHMSKVEVEVGDTVTRGELLGLIGSTGRSTGPHLHYEMRLFARSINPRHFLPPEPIQITKGSN